MTRSEGYKWGACGQLLTLDTFAARVFGRRAWAGLSLALFGKRSCDTVDAAAVTMAVVRRYRFPFVLWPAGLRWMYLINRLLVGL